MAAEMLQFYNSKDRCKVTFKIDKICRYIYTSRYLPIGLPKSLDKTKRAFFLESWLTSFRDISKKMENMKGTIIIIYWCDGVQSK